MTDTLPLREQIARIIDGGAWQRHGFTGDPDWHPDDQRLEQRRSLAKADAITALLPSLPDGWVAVPEEPTEEIIEAMNAAYLSTRRHGVSGQTIEAVWRAKYGPEIVAYRAMLSARPTPPTAEGIGNTDTPPTEPPSGWQPIETAPRDGTPVLLTCGERALEPDGDTHCDIGRWGKDFWGEPSWVMNAGGDWPNATYWQPTPAPPEPLETER